MDKLLFGAAYYAEYAPYDRVEVDLEMMKRAGMNVIRIGESTWSTLEPEEGVFDFSYIDRVLEVAEKEKIWVIIGTPTYAIPSWLAMKDESILVESKDGKAWYGPRQNMDITNKTFRYYAERVIREIVKHTVSNKQVIGFQLDNETKHYGTAGKNVQKLFKQYLIEKFETPQKMNKAFGLEYWSNSIISWEQFPDVRGTINASLACEFDKFRRRLAAEYIHWQAEIVKEYCREEQFITHNFDYMWKLSGSVKSPEGFSYGLQPGIDHDLAARCLTIAGTDIYHPTQNELTGAEIAFGGDEIRSLKQNNYLVLETQAQGFKGWLPYPGQLRIQAYSHLASGALGVMYWHWNSLHNSYESYWKGVLSHDMLPNPTYEEAVCIGNEWQKNGNRINNLKKKAKVAIMIDNVSQSAMQWFPIEDELSYNDIVRWMYDSLYEMNIECDVIFPSCTNLEKYQMLVLPALYCASNELLEKIKKFVADGGVLIGTFKSCVADENVKIHSDIQPHILHECFGVSYNQFTQPRGINLWGEEVRYWMELLKPESAESIIDYSGPYWNQYAAITKNQYKNGTAYYIGCYTTKCALKRILEDAAEKACVMPEHKIIWPIIIRSGINTYGERVHYILHYSDKETEIECPYSLVEDILTGMVYKLGEMIKLSAWAVLVLCEIE